MNASKTVFVGLSGGVDSSVAALRLIKEGYNVVGVFIKVWQPDFLDCNWEAERLDAMRVAAHLGIQFLTCDGVDAYRDEVGSYFIESYKKGLTPNPDVMCNKYVKFGVFLDFALANGADYVATGHYAQRELLDAKFYLRRGVDTNKDQSYFLWTLTQTQLGKILFPCGNSPKSVIREEAEEAKLPTATKKDSQGVCFLGHIDIPEFLSNFVELKEGAVLDINNKVIGTHSGALTFTLGQRHGFQVPGTTDSSGNPLFVVEKNIENNTITVASEAPMITAKDKISLTDMNWITALPSDEPLEAQFRYRQTPFSVKLTDVSTTKPQLTLEESTEQPALGQSCVLYRGDVLLGGGIISV